MTRFAFTTLKIFEIVSNPPYILYVIKYCLYTFGGSDTILELLIRDSVMRKEESAKLKQIYNEKARGMGLTYEKIAQLMGFKSGAYSSVSHMLNGINDINLLHGVQFCEILQIELRDFSPRLESEANRIASQVRTPAPAQGAADVNWLVGETELAISNHIKRRTKSEHQVYWPGKHSEQTYCIEVLSEANAPLLPSGAICYVDFEADLKAGKMICVNGKNKITFAKYLGDNLATLLNDNFPNRTIEINEEDSVGLVIGHQVSS